MRDALRDAFRACRADPWTTVTIVVTLGVSTGLNATVLALVYGILLRPLPYADPSRLVTLGQEIRFAELQAWASRLQTAAAVAAYAPASHVLRGLGAPHVVKAAFVSDNFFEVLGVRGAAPIPSGAAASGVFVSERTARALNLDPQSLVGRPVSVAGLTLPVLAVLPAGVAFPAEGTELWIPASAAPPVTIKGDEDARWFKLVARMKPGATVAQAAGDASRVSEEIAPGDGKHPSRVPVQPLRDSLYGDSRSLLAAFSAAAFIVLLVSCANVSTLLLGRASSREQELAVRLALGASRGRVALQAMAEIVPLLVIGGATGVALAAYAVNAFIPLAPPTLPRVENIRISLEVLLASIAVLSVTGLIATLLPAAQAWSADLTGATREETRSSTGSVRQSRARNALVVIQVALALPLLVGGVLLTRTFAALNAQSPGFERENILTAHLAFPRSKYRDDPAISQVEDRILESVARLPGVTASGMVNRLPLAGGSSMVIFEFDSPRPLHPELSAVDMRVASPDYFKAMGIRVLEGRAFDARDTAESTPVGVIDERIAKLMWPGESAIGKRFRVAPHLMKTPWYEIIGLVAHIRHDALDVDTRMQVYWNFAQMPMDRMALVVRTDSNAAALTPSVVRAVHEIDPEQPLYDVRTMSEWVDRSLGQRWMNMTLVGAFAAVALTLCSIGVYGVIAFGVARQRREFGIRLALGASRRGIAAAVVTHGLSLAAIGIAAGLVFSVGVSRSMSSLLFGVKADDLVSFGAATAVILTVALLASYLPARRAAAVDPAVTLRAE